MALYILFAARMYELPGNLCCPVLSFRKYISKLHHDCTALWQHPLDAFLDDEQWFCYAPVGKNLLGMLMRDISGEAQLRQVYTNHSIWATNITTLDDAGFEA